MRMNRSRQLLPLLSLLLLVPMVSWAGNEPEPLAPSADAPVASGSSFSIVPTESSGLPGTQDMMSQVRSRPTTGLRLLAEAGAGLLTGAAVAVGGGVLALNLSSFPYTCSSGGSSMNFCGIGRVVAGGMIGMVVGIPVGVWWGGLAAGGKGMLLATLAGSALGVAAGLGLWALNSTVGAASYLTLPMLFSITAYELTDALRQPSPQTASSGFSVRPMLAPTSGGALLGLNGRF